MVILRRGRVGLVFFLLALIQSSWAESGEIAWRALQEYRKDPHGSVSSPAIRDLFSGLDDAQKIDEIFDYLIAYDRKLENTPYAMPQISDSPFVVILRNDPGLISNIDHLRDLLKDERDPRRFFLLSRLAAVFAVERKIEFSREMKHMLLERGKVSNARASARNPRYEDAALYTYGVILNDLERAGVRHPFEID